MAATAFSTQGSTPNQGFNPPSTPMASTPQAGALNRAQTGMTLPSAPHAPALPIASQVHSDAAGNTVKTTYAVPKTEGETSGMLSKQPKPQTSPMAIKMVNGMHHVPFTDNDGTMKYINAHGNIIQ